MSRQKKAAAIPKKNKRKEESKPTLKLPNIIEVKQDDNNWKEFGFDGNTGVYIVHSGEDYDVYVNMSNDYYLNELKNAKGGDQFLVTNQYKYGLVLASMSMIYKMKSGQLNGEDIYEKVNSASRGIAMTIVPLIRTLGTNVAKKL